MAAPRDHVLGRLVIEPAVATPARLASLWNRLGRFGAGPLAAAIDEVMSRLVAPDEVVQLDRLELDIGRVREDHLEDDLIIGVRRALEDALRDRLGATAPLATAPAEPRTLARRLAESVGFVAVHGALPWWHAAADPDELDALIRAALAQSRDETRRAVLRAGQLQSARRRLALQLATATLHELVRLIEAGHAEFVIDYVLALEREHAQRPIVPATGSELRVAAWELVLAYLIVDRGSQFNHKRFVAATVAGLAQRFGLDYAALLRELRRGLPRVARAAEPLHQLLDELWYELDHAPAPDAAAPLERGDAADDAQIAQLDALLRRGLPPVGAPTEFDDAFRALRHDPGRLRWVILAHWHRDRVRQRLGERPDELLIELVHVVLPSHAAEIVSYGRALDRAHAARPVIAADAARFRRTRWRFFLDTLMLQHGSAFNTRAFIRATLERLAAHDNTTYDALVAWLWRELAGLPRSATSAHPVVLHLGALYRELRTRGSARHDEATADAAPRGAMAAILDRVAPQDHALARAVLRFVGTLPELATCAFGRGLGSRAIAAQVQQLARAVLGSSGDRRLRPVELLDGLLTRIAEASAVPRDEVLRWALRRKARLGSVRDEVRGLVESFARAAGLARAAPAGPAAPGGNDDPARALTGWLLRGAGDAHTPRQAELAVWLDQLERGGNTALRARIAELLRDAPVRRRVVATAGNAALVRLWAWRRPAQHEAVTEVVASLDPLGRALGSSRQARALHEAFWQFLWSRRAARARRGSQLLALFVEQLARRKPRLIALLRSRAAGHHLVDRALAGTAPRQPHKDAPRAEAKPRAQPAPKRPREPIAAPVFVDAADRQALRRWSAAHPTASVAVEAAIRDALTALGRVGFSLDREADRVALRAAFWQLVEATARPPLDSNAWLAALFDRLRRDAPTLLARLRATAAGERLLGSVQPSPRAASREPPATIEPSPPEWLVRTAGVVLLWSMLPRYFERLGMLERGSFRDLASQERACGLIHFLASGQRTLREHEQVLGKVLCGFDVAAPIPLELELDDATRAMSEDLLRFVIASWKGIGETSVQGLRGTFLCRDGRLTRREASWMLDVEHKTYDILLGSFPWQMSVVKLPWMVQPLMVHWR